MALEIERKFLVNTLPDGMPEGVRIVQGYLSTKLDCIVRIRIYGDKGYLTIKGLTEGISRPEFEYEIPLEDAETMLSFCGSRIDKHRFLMPFDGYTWEVDVFSGDNAGLVVAEIELPAQNTAFQRPDWAGKEVSHLERYFNACLSERPYTSWTKAEQDAVDA